MLIARAPGPAMRAAWVRATAAPSSPPACAAWRYARRAALGARSSSRPSATRSLRAARGGLPRRRPGRCSPRRTAVIRSAIAFTAGGSSRRPASLLSPADALWRRRALGARASLAYPLVRGVEPLMPEIQLPSSAMRRHSDYGPGNAVGWPLPPSAAVCTALRSAPLVLSPVIRLCARARGLPEDGTCAGARISPRLARVLGRRGRRFLARSATVHRCAQSQSSAPSGGCFRRGCPCSAVHSASCSRACPSSSAIPSLLGDCAAVCTVQVPGPVRRFRLVGGCFRRGCLCSAVPSASRFGLWLFSSPIPGSLGDCAAVCTVPVRAAVRGFLNGSVASQIVGPAASAAGIVCTSSLEG